MEKQIGTYTKCKWYDFERRNDGVDFRWVCIAYGAFALFSFVTLPVEFDASKRALAWIENSGIATHEEFNNSKDALKWAAMTYVVAALGALVTLIYYASMLLGNRD